MSDNEEFRRTLAGLRKAVAAPDLSDQVQDQARELLTRIGSGARVVVLGPKGVGKTALCNVLLGVDMGEATTASQLRVFTNADVFRSACNDCQQFDISDRVSVSSDFLRYIQLIDVDTKDGLGSQSGAVRSIMAYADMVIWCTEEFGAQEADIWSSASDHLKDRSFLVLGKADAWAQDSTLHDRLAVLQNVVAEEFHSLFPITTLAVHADLAQGRDITERDLAASGIKALSNTVQNMASSGRRADLDSAYLFLDRYGVEISQSASETNSQPSSVSIPTSYNRALEIMRARAKDFSALAQEGLSEQVADILSLTNEVSEEISEVLSEEKTQCAQFDAFRKDVFGANDKLLLMSLENDVRSAADAMTILVQLKRELECRAIE